MDPSEFAGAQSDIEAVFRSQRKKIRKTEREERSAGSNLPVPRHQKGELFIRGPIPMKWVKAASTCGQRAEAVTILLWQTVGWQKKNPLRLTHRILQELNVHPKTAKRVLSRMADIGLVEVEFHRGRSPVVTLLDYRPGETGGR